MSATTSDPAATAPARPDEQGHGPPTGARGVGLRFLGHSTVVIDLPGIRIVTDPFLRERLGPLRRHGPLPRPATIGPVSFALVSHAHPDHFDRASLRLLPGDPLVIAPRGLGGRIRRTGLRAREVVVDESVALADGWTITAVPARHWRWITAPTASTLGYLIEGPGGPGIYFAGDTARFDGLRHLAGRVDIALLPVGSWGPHLSPGHLSPRSAAELARDLDARVALPIHWGTLYPRGLERRLAGPLTEPARRFADWAARVAPGTDVRLVEPGGSTTVER